MKVNFPFRLRIAWVLYTALCGDNLAATGQEAIERAAVKSSTIASAGYLTSGGTLEIEFHTGAAYRYRRVPKEVFDALIAARSKGRFFGSEIRGKYPFEKLKGKPK